MLSFNKLVEQVLDGESDVDFVNQSSISELDLSESLEYFYISLDEPLQQLEKIKRLANVLKKMPNINTLKIHSCHFKLEWFSCLFDELKETNITRVSLWNNFQCEEDIAELISKTNHTKLRDLDLTDCIQFGNSHKHDRANFMKIVEALAESPLSSFKIYDLSEKMIEDMKKTDGMYELNAKLASELSWRVEHKREMIKIKSEKDEIQKSIERQTFKLFSAIERIFPFPDFEIQKEENKNVQPPIKQGKRKRKNS